LAGHPVAGKTAQERVEQRIKELYSQLRITPAERPQWDQFAQVMRDNARDMDQAWLQRVDNFQSLNAVQNMQSYEQIAEQHAQHLQKLVPAFQNLYNSMPDEQKRLADQVFRANAERQAQTRRAPRVSGALLSLRQSPACGGALLLMTEGASTREPVSQGAI
jgi:hypothetical protein